ncbi:MAG: CpsB/CapC family capsule biosynthesis tyrosine phosphatase [Nanoarchaeota archaeon]|nr:CpsB/CapC family capsule biosynthesis tyrosine phosphatase [Nanoarchaeota archaeon]
MIDIHSHILYGIYDSPLNIDISLEVAKLYVKHGFTHVVSTPHYYAETESLDSFLDNCNIRYDKLGKAIKKLELKLEIIHGAEVMLCPELLLYKNDIQKLCISGTNLLLVELPLHSMPSWVKTLLFEIQLMAIIPIIAHPERNYYIQQNIQKVFDMSEQGLLFQADAFSLLEGGAAKKCFEKLLDNEVIDFLATDVHKPDNRIPCFNRAINLIKRKYGYKVNDKIINNSLLCIPGN